MAKVRKMRSTGSMSKLPKEIYDELSSTGKELFVKKLKASNRKKSQMKKKRTENSNLARVITSAVRKGMMTKRRKKRIYKKR